MNKSRWFISILLTSATMIFLLRSFFLPSYLTEQSSKGKVNDIELSYAKHLKLPAYYHYLQQQSPQGSNDWLGAMRKLSTTSAEYALELAQYYHQDNHIGRAEFWYQQAAKQQDDLAYWVLANLYAEQENYVLANEMLAPLLISKNNEIKQKAQLLAIDIALTTGDRQELTTLVAGIKEAGLTNQAGQHTLLSELTRYRVITDKRIESLVNQDARDTCPASIQMFATTLADLRYLDELILTTMNTPLGAFVCFPTPRYLPLTQLKCTHSADEMISCDELSWQSYQAPINSRFLGIMLPAGGANVNQGIMYLDRHDSLSVFHHELSHLLGFIDEYPLPKNHAKCLAVQTQPFSHNVAVLPQILTGDRAQVRAYVLSQLAWGEMIKDDTPVLSADIQGWRLGTPEKYRDEIGLFISDSCQGHREVNDVALTLQSFKPLAKLTSLNYHELAFPAQYLAMLKRQPQLFLMPSYRNNIVNARAQRQN